MINVLPSSLTDPFDGRLERPDTSPFEGVDCPRPLFNPKWLPIIAGLISRLDDPALWDFDLRDETQLIEWENFKLNIIEIYEKIVGIGVGNLIKNIYADGCIIWAVPCDGDEFEVLDVTQCIAAQGIPLIQPTLPEGGGNIPSGEGATTPDPDAFQDIDITDCDGEKICGGAFKVVDYLENKFRQFYAEVVGIAGAVGEYFESIVPVGDVLRQAKVERYTQIADLVIALSEVALEQAFSIETKEEAACAIYCTVLDNNCVFDMGTFDRARRKWGQIDVVWGLISSLTSGAWTDSVGKLLGLGAIIPRRAAASRFRLGLDEPNDDCALVCPACEDIYNLRTLAVSDLVGGVERTIDDANIQVIGGTYNRTENLIELDITDDGGLTFDAQIFINFGEYLNITGTVIRIEYVGAANQGANFELFGNGRLISTASGSQNPREQNFNSPAVAGRYNGLQYNVFGNIDPALTSAQARITLLRFTGKGEFPDIVDPSP